MLSPDGQFGAGPSVPERHSIRRLARDQYAQLEGLDLRLRPLAPKVVG
jgi:hypothetical protein